MNDAELSRQEWIAERAGIYEFDAGYSRAEAEMRAKQLWDTVRNVTDVNRNDDATR